MPKIISDVNIVKLLRPVSDLYKEKSLGKFYFADLSEVR